MSALRTAWSAIEFQTIAGLARVTERIGLLATRPAPTTWAVNGVVPIPQLIVNWKAPRASACVLATFRILSEATVLRSTTVAPGAVCPVRTTCFEATSTSSPAGRRIVCRDGA